jgi:hypothetical protein
MWVYGQVAVTLYLTSAEDGGEWSTPRNGLFTPGNEPGHILQEMLLITTKKM